MTGRHEAGGGRRGSSGHPRVPAQTDGHAPTHHPGDSYAHLPRIIRLAVSLSILVLLIACCAGGAWLLYSRAAATKAEATARAVAVAARNEETTRTRRAEADGAAKAFFDTLLAGRAASVKSDTTSRARRVFDKFVRQVKRDRAFGYSVTKVTSDGEVYSVAGYTHLPKGFRPVTMAMVRKPVDAAAPDGPATFVITNIVPAADPTAAIPK